MSTKPFQTATTSLVVMSTTSVTILAAGVGSAYRSISNTSGQIMYVLFGSGTALVGNHTIPMAPGSLYEFPAPLYSGTVTASLASGAGNILVTSY